MELIGWCWMLLALGLIFIFIKLYVLAIVFTVGSLICFVKYFRDEKLTQDDIVDNAKSLVKIYKGI